MAAVLDLIEKQGFLVLDGGLATELERRGEGLNHALWSAKILLSDPQKIEEVHYSYFEAGADVAITASYQASFAGLQATGLSATEAAKVIQTSATVAMDARERFWSDPQNRKGRVYPLIAASIGPYGAFLHDGSEYTGAYGVSVETLKNFHRDRLGVLSDSGADVLACESIPSLMEARALADLLREFSRLPAWVSFICQDETHLSDGEEFTDALRIVANVPSVFAVGLNCTAPGLVSSLLKRAKKVTDTPLVVYPNSGELYNVQTCSWQPSAEVGLIEKETRNWYELGARLIGGCCRTTPETIRAIRSALTPALANSGNS